MKTAFDFVWLFTELADKPIVLVTIISLCSLILAALAIYVVILSINLQKRAE